jgi:4-hydroxy-tetrahydrodipicolinate synthase
MKAKYITPAVTPLTENGQFDEEGLAALYDRLVAGGVSGILILGSIGEFFGFGQEDKKKLIRLAVRLIDGRVPLLVGTGGMDPAQTTALSQFAFDAGAQAVVVISPYYFALDAGTVEAYYAQVAASCPGPLYLYNFPDRTGYDLSPETVTNLAMRHENIVGVKDTLAGMDHTRQIIRQVKPQRPEFEIFSGFDDNFAHNLLSGGDGCIGGLSNLVPEWCGEWIAAFGRGDMVAVADIQQRIDALMAVYGVGKPFVPYIKQAMRQRGLPIGTRCAAPAPEVTPAQAEQVRRILTLAGL